MKPVLVLALGNAFAGDDGVACEVAAQLARCADIRDLADVHCAGTDLLRAAALMRGRRRLVVVDAVLQDGPGSVQVLGHHELHGHAAGGGAHTLDPVAALELLRSLDAEIAAADTFWVLIGVASVRLGAGLSGSVRALLPEAVGRAGTLVRCAAAPA